jgi:HK97 family phage major capsid protein
MAEIKEEIMQVLTQMRAEHKTAIEEATKNGATISGEAKANVATMNKRIDELELKLQKKEVVLPGESKLDEKKTAEKKAFLSWMRHGKRDMDPSERKALVEDATGQILVPEDLEAEVYRLLPGLTPMRGLCTVRTTGRDRVRVRGISDVTVGWGKLETGAAIPESTPVPVEAYIYVEDLYGLAKIGEDELMDSDANLAAFLADSFAVALATAENTGFVVGTGHALQQPGGIAVNAVLRAGLTTGCGANAAGTYGNSWTTDDTVLINDLLRCEYRLPVQYLAGATWLFNRTTELAARILQAAGTGAYLWQPSLLVGQPNQFDGFPIANSSDMNFPADTLAATNVIFGNFKRGYAIIDRLGMTLQRLDELYAESGLVGFKVHKRVGGGLIRPEPFMIIVNDI